MPCQVPFSTGASKNDLASLEQRLTLKIGGMLVIAVGMLTALLKPIN